METLDTQSVDTAVDVETTEELDSELSSLPSDEEAKAKIADGFQLTDELREKYFKNDKFFGRFDNIEGMALALKSVEDKYSSVMRDIKSGKYQEVADTVQDTDTTPQVTADNPLVQEFFSNGMELTDDLMAKAKEAGYDIRDIKLAAIEIKEQVGKAYAIVGGESEYKSMVEWAKSNLDEKSAKQFDREIASGMGEYAIKGLYAEYKSSTANSQEPEYRSREYGDSTAKVSQGYTSQAELLRDKAYIESPRGRNDTKAIEAFNRKMAKTPDNVIFGR